MVYEFGAFEVDDELFELRRNGIPVSISRKPFDTLLLLIRNQHRVVTKEELVRGPWQGAAVSDAALNQVIKIIRRVLGEDPSRTAVIVTVRGRGFRFECADAKALVARDTPRLFHFASMGILQHHGAPAPPLPASSFEVQARSTGTSCVPGWPNTTPPSRPGRSAKCCS